MIIKPSINDLMEKFDSRYTLAMAAAKRARQIAEGSKSLSEEEADSKPVSLAINELFEDKIKYISPVSLDTVQNESQDTVEKAASDVMPKTIPETASKTIPETIPETASKTIPETIPETASKTIPEIIPETIPEKIP